MIRRRDLLIAAGSVAATLSVVAVAQPAATLIGPSVFEWREMKVMPTEMGEVRQVMRGPTATLDELELHVTTLRAGVSSHPPHTHENEELVIVREGTVEVLNGGSWKRLGPGSVIFNASNDPHALRNVGNGPATYHVINWSPPKSR